MQTSGWGIRAVRLCWLVVLLSSLSKSGQALVQGEPSPDLEPPDYAREVLPILADKCFTCHGPDASSRRGGLRLDLEAEARESGVFERDPGGESDCGDRMMAEDEGWRMPPPEAKNDLTEAERALLLRWIGDGAPYGRHWAFEPLPEEVAVPAVGDPWALNSIDRFVAARHGSLGIEPTSSAAPARWLRRVTLDLTGLPPTHAQVESFLADPSPEARARVVDRLLSSPSFGERMATPWLDVARYADSYGYQADLLSPTWPYRDWVVQSLNRNQPYNEFLVEQLAGDLLEDPTLDQRLATAFNRLHRLTNEGGSVEEERRYESVVDRVETLGSAVMGLTLGCARCHDHKFDPVSQADFFGLYAFFDGIDEWGMYHDSSRVPTPSILLPDESQRRALRDLEEAVQRSDAALEAAKSAPIPDLAPGSSLDRLGPGPGAAGPMGPTVDLVFDGAQPAEDGRVRFGEESGPHCVVSSDALIDADHGDEGTRAGVRLDGDGALGLNNVGEFGPFQPLTLELEITVPAEVRDAVVAHRTGGTDVGYFGFDLMLVDGYLRARQVRFWPGNAAAIISDERVPTGRPVSILYVQDGTGWAGGMGLVVDGQRGQEELVDDLKKLPGAGPGGVGGGGLQLGARFRDTGLKGGIVHRVRRWDRALDDFGIVRLLDPSSLVGDGGMILDEQRGPAARHLSHRSASMSGLRRELAAARRALFDARTAVLEVAVMEESPWASRSAHVLERGDYDAPRTDENRVERRIPAALAGPLAPQLEDRLALAHWLTNPNHPLTARVAVNRLWQEFFGAGLVATPADFGVQGARPTHPELLDWLARSFVDSGWDVKELCRLMVLSATYGQDSAGKGLADDPDNLLLARGPRRRLSAEMLRDTALFASGLMDFTMGGPPVSPYQPPGLWRESNSMSPAYHQSVGRDLYRRSLYSVVKRTAPLPNMTVLDAPSRELSCAGRESTSTPLQGLVLLNDVQFVEAARALAQRAMDEADVDADRVAWIFLSLASRDPDEHEAGVLQGVLVEERAAFQAAPAEAAALVAVGESEAPAADVVELAALTVVAQLILNLDAVVMKR